MKRRSSPQLDIPSKANRILNVILVGFLLIILRIWHLGIIQHEDRVEEARKPQRRLVIEPSKRGTIRDRFNIPLAINKVRYRAAVLYEQIRLIPAVAWESQGGKRIQRFKRREYISELAQVLGEELQLDPERLEDLIHAKASLYTHHPYVIKEDLSEREYYRLKMLEKDWPGIHTQLLPVRYYPYQKVAGDIVGYMGAISREEYEKVIREIGVLEDYLKGSECGEECDLPEGIYSHQEAENRLESLIDFAYSLNDSVGKTGIEGRYEEKLRGFQGKKIYFSDARGHYLRELEGAKEAQSGQRILLTISSELQEYAEKLLIQNESMREIRVESRNQNEREKGPWIKGGAIVAFDPRQGDILALASYPRYDPNDFIPSGNQELAGSKNRNIRRWLELEAYIGEIWDRKRPIERERYDLFNDAIDEEKLWLTWENYLDFILPPHSPVRKGLDKVGTVGHAVRLQAAVDGLLELCGQPNAYALFNAIYQGNEHIVHKRLQLPGQKEALAGKMKDQVDSIRQMKAQIDPYFIGIPENYDKVLLVDLCRLVADGGRFPKECKGLVSLQSLAEHQDASASIVVLSDAVRGFCKDLFHATEFKQWRQENQKEFLKQKRIEERAIGKRYGASYIDLLDSKENELFIQFWQENRSKFILAILTGERAPHDTLAHYYAILSTWHHELSQGAHQEIAWAQAYWSLHKIVKTLSQEDAAAYLATLRGYDELSRPLLGRYPSLRQCEGKQLEMHLAAGFYPLYGFGYSRSFAYRQAAPQGSVFKLVTAYEALIQKYKEGQKGSVNPLEIVDHTHERGGKTFVGYDSQGSPIPQIYKGGRIPQEPPQWNRACGYA